MYKSFPAHDGHSWLLYGSLCIRLTSSARVWIIELEAHFKSRGGFMPKDDLMPIGELARRTGMASSALRYYERIGLLSPAERAGQQRRYTESSAERVALIRLYQDAGFTLAEIGRLLKSMSRGRRGWGPLAERKIAELETRIAGAARAKEMLQHALECPHRDILACPNFRSALEAQLP
jgi:MerR family redox-sensitive transcriptional activator SoxR